MLVGVSGTGTRERLCRLPQAWPNVPGAGGGHGICGAGRIHHWYWTGDIFVCPSQWQEPLARVLYEAMASGLPIVTTKRGGNTEVISGNGLVVENAEDPGEFAEKIAVLLDNPDLCRQMGEKGRAFAERKFGWARVAREILVVWGNP